MDNEPAVNPIPPVVIVLCLIVVLVELVLSAAAAGMIGGPQGLGWRINAMQDYAFFPAVLDRVISVGDYSMNVMKRLVTYGFVHASFTQALFAAALLLALGQVRRRCVQCRCRFVGRVWVYDLWRRGVWPDRRRQHARYWGSTLLFTG